MRCRLLAAALLIHSSLAWSLSVPKGSSFDARIQHVNYNADNVVLIKTKPGRATRITFAPDEKILHVSSGFTNGWEFDKRKNVLLIKARSVAANGTQSQINFEPKPGQWDTNLMVETDVRSYDFDLHLLPEKAANRLISYRVVFHYPEENARKLALKAARESMSRKSVPQNWSYTMQVGENSDIISPTAAYDDGLFTYLTIPNSKEFPTPFLVSDDKHESRVDFFIDPSAPDTLVVERVTKELVLRLGDAVVGIYNEGFNPNRVSHNQGTSVPGIKRIIKAEGIEND